MIDNTHVWCYIYLLKLAGDDIPHRDQHRWDHSLVLGLEGTSIRQEIAKRNSQLIADCLGCPKHRCLPERSQKWPPFTIDLTQTNTG